MVPRDLVALSMQKPRRVSDYYSRTPRPLALGVRHESRGVEPLQVVVERRWRDSQPARDIRRSCSACVRRECFKDSGLLGRDRNRLPQPYGGHVNVPLLLDIVVDHSNPSREAHECGRCLHDSGPPTGVEERRRRLDPSCLDAVRGGSGDEVVRRADLPLVQLEPKTTTCRTQARKRGPGSAIRARPEERDDALHVLLRRDRVRDLLRRVSQSREDVGHEGPSCHACTSTSPLDFRGRPLPLGKDLRSHVDAPCDHATKRLCHRPPVASRRGGGGG